MECKYDSREMSELIKGTELIDTLWNVNRVNVLFFVHDIGELIDTLWNVNMYCCSQAELSA